MYVECRDYLVCSSNDTHTPFILIVRLDLRVLTALFTTKASVLLFWFNLIIRGCKSSGRSSCFLALQPQTVHFKLQQHPKAWNTWRCEPEASALRKDSPHHHNPLNAPINQDSSSLSTFSGSCVNVSLSRAQASFSKIAITSLFLLQNPWTICTF